MARTWKDPRDGRPWLVEATPFEVPPDPGETTIPMGWQLLFESGASHCTILVAYEVGSRLDGMSDRELIALLDASRAG